GTHRRWEMLLAYVLMQLATAIEQLGAVDLSGVQVHYNSSEPAQINALAYTQGQDIHIGPSQEQHLPHEGWHVVQQMQGRVKPTVQAKLPINDDHRLEREADLMGAKAAALQNSVLAAPVALSPAMSVQGESTATAKVTLANAPIQMVKPANKAEAIKIPPLCKSKVKKAGDRKRGKHGGREIKEQLIDAGEDATVVNALTFMEYDANAWDGVPYDEVTKTGGRDAERIVVGSDGRVWFTGGHYAVGSFEELT
ncbi:MAG: DUF4157 domain-containing protein, partial [Cyanobacteria bacterium]|nr:DUF4157 domain-containing protein [Cyanobacteriota bacterium]